jgi:hypothetical protein
LPTVARRSLQISTAQPLNRDPAFYKNPWE